MKKGIHVVLICMHGMADATIYKCVDEAGTIHYQKTECEADHASDVMKVRETPEVVVIEENSRGDDRRQSQLKEWEAMKNKPAVRSMSDAQIKASQKVCQQLWQAYRQEQKAVKDRCVKDKDIYCDQSADAIEATNLERDIKNTYTFVRRDKNPQLYMPKLFQLKQALRETGCAR